jgi:hypothetical protein
MLSCAVAVGFLNGFDVFFYLSARNLSPNVNTAIASATAFLLPDISALATLYTPAYAASLGDAGVQCAGILIFDLFTASAALAFQVVRIIAVAGGILLFVAAVIWAAVMAIIAGSNLILQITDGFIFNVTVIKLRFKSRRDLDAIAKTK